MYHTKEFLIVNIVLKYRLTNLSQAIVLSYPQWSLKPFQRNVSFLYSSKTSENLWFVKEYRNGALG